MKREEGRVIIDSQDKQILALLQKEALLSVADIGGRYR